MDYVITVYGGGKDEGYVAIVVYGGEVFSIPKLFERDDVAHEYAEQWMKVHIVR
jgi:hypothetical protein